MFEEGETIGDGVEGTLVGAQFCVMNDRSWRSFNLSEAKDIHYGILHIIDLNPCLVEVLEKEVDPSDIAAVIEGMAYLGECERIQDAYFEFVTNYHILFASFDFTEEGKADLLFAGNIPSPSAANAIFKNIVLSGRRLLDDMEHSIRRTFGEESTQFKEWHAYAAQFYDESLSYALCYDIRNCIEHDRVLFVSAVNIDAEQQTVGFAINLENELFDTSLKGPTKDKLKQFLYDRKADGRSPWISLSRVVKNHFAQINILYVCFLDAMINAVLPLCEAAEQEHGALNPINCVVRKMPPLHPDDDAPASRVYKLAPSVPIAYYQIAKQEILEANEEAMKSFC